MAKKNHYYVLVLTENGPVFVTSVPERNWCVWDKNEAPRDFGSKSYAEEIAWGLRMNGFQAYMITLDYEIGGQPFRYDLGDFQWVWNKDKKEENNDRDN